MERTIGNYERRIRLPADPYGNLNQEIIEQATTNALLAMDPSFRPPPKTQNQRLSIDIGSGYVSLHPRGTHLMDVSVTVAFREFCEANNWTFERQTDTDSLQVTRFARLRLPNGQEARSLWKEANRETDLVRRARNVKPLLTDLRYAEVLYYFTAMQGNTQFTLAAVMFYSNPDPDIQEESLGMLNVCTKEEDVQIIDAKWIVEVVGMIPFRRPEIPWNDEEDTSEYFVLEKLYSNVVRHDTEDEQDSENE
ncbi:hypothetical protein E1B28_010947 [Marasmius oreades]|uniref:Uncharacterized protein n=1 Tax=Marasmius oreades TaxID=181124 RepID=A0A9P7RUF7_9AGAR|nr:uncharacterized protein E1B28_010947 [Marasmius oreades]KAG7089248.1 hypothetical protein E1B28_010947 [Marasmius oreades]